MIFFPLKIDICVFAVDETFSKKNYEPIWSCTLLNTEVCTRCHKCRCEWTGSIKMLMSVHYASLYSFSLSILSLLFHCLSFVSKLFSLFFTTSSCLCAKGASIHILTWTVLIKSKAWSSHGLLSKDSSVMWGETDWWGKQTWDLWSQNQLRFFRGRISLALLSVAVLTWTYSEGDNLTCPLWAHTSDFLCSEVIILC